MFIWIYFILQLVLVDSIQKGYKKQKLHEFNWVCYRKLL